MTNEIWIFQDVQGAVEKQLDEYVLSTSADASGLSLLRCQLNKQNS